MEGHSLPLTNEMKLKHEKFLAAETLCFDFSFEKTLSSRMRAHEWFKREESNEREGRRICIPRGFCLSFDGEF